MTISEKDRSIVRDLAARVAKVAAHPLQEKTIADWKALNGLRPNRPMVMMDQLPWHEMDVDGELELHCEDGLCRGYEGHFRRTLYLWDHMRVDAVVEPDIGVHRAIGNTGFGIQVQEETARMDPRNGVVGHLYLDQMQTDDDIARIQTPRITHNEEATKRNLEAVQELFDGILPVRLRGMTPGFAPWDTIVMWRGAETCVFDLIQRPDFMHRLMRRVTEAMTSMLDQIEDQGLLDASWNTIHCCGAHTDELPAPGFDPNHVRARDVWTCGMAQIFSTVSPAMHQEFELEYANKWYERFGLVYYGCCEPLDDRISIIRDIPHVRKISMSPWVNQESGAEQIGGDFVFSRKPNPAFLAHDPWNPEAVERDLRETLEACQRHGCPVEFILKDVSTCHYEPQRLWEWADVAMSVAGREPVTA